MLNDKILILGHGEMGHAFEYLLRQRAEVAIWTRAAEMANKLQLENLAGDAAMVIFCLPVVAHAAIAQRLAKSVSLQSICITIAKGLDETGRPAIAIMRECLPAQRHALMYGPMISEEIRAGKPAFAQLGSHDAAIAQLVAAVFKDTSLYLQASRDMLGISWAVILKNVYAILFGVADELGLGDNMRGFLVSQALVELAEILQIKGGEADSAFGLAGVGDLITTATSESSHHHSLGRCLARNDCETIRGEGVHTVAMVEKHRLFPIEKYPLFDLCRHILADPQHCENRMEVYLRGLLRI